MAEIKSKISRAFDVGFKIILVFGIALLLLAYNDVSYKEHALASEIQNLRVKLDHGGRVVRKKRSFSLDELFTGITNRLDSLERR